MSKNKDKNPKPRPDKYEEKVKINIPFADTMRILAEGANKAAKVKKETKK